MSIHNARRFIEKLRDDHDFRKKTLAASGPEDLFAFLYAEGLVFDQRELVGAMAECMQQLASLKAV